jgi:hypothetical protein
MAQFPRPLEHQGIETKDDETLRREAQEYLVASPELQLIAELIATLRTLSLPWWSPDVLRSSFTAPLRFAWYKARPDLRQRITSSLTGLAAKTARKAPHALQAELVDSALNEGDVSSVTFEEVFDPRDLAIYGSAEQYWRLFREKMPWDDDAQIHQELIAALLRALMEEKSTAYPGLQRKPILSALDVRTAIDSRIWHARLPVEVRAAIDDVRLQKERAMPEVPSRASDDLAIATAEIIAKHIPLRDLSAIFAAAEVSMGISGADGVDQPQRATSRPRGTSPPPLRKGAMPTATPPEAKPSPRQSVSTEQALSDVELIVVDDEEAPDSEDETRLFTVK